VKIRFILTGEGSSDLNLVDHIQSILIEEGFTEASGEAPDLSMFPQPIGRTVREKLTALLRHYPHADVIFVHRDADTAGIPAREREIFDAALGVVSTSKVIPLIPVTQLETWLLTDSNAIKRIAGNGKHRGELACLPTIRQLENVADAKNLLLDALCEASQTQGGRLRKFKARFSEMRTRLAFDLDASGPVGQLASYQYFRTKVNSFAQSKLQEDVDAR
jgi:hypothetical protein